MDSIENGGPLEIHGWKLFRMFANILENFLLFIYHIS